MNKPSEQALTERLDADFDPQHPATLQQVGAIAKVLYQSDYFDDLKGASQACVKIIAGKELGIPAIASVREINVFDGNIELSYTMMGSLLRQHEEYDYDIVESSHLRAEILFKRNGQELGTSAFTVEDAARADLCKIGDDGWPIDRTRSGRKMPWEKYPKAMCLARAMSQGVRTYTPDVAHGSIYAKGEISEEPRYVGEARVVDETPNSEPAPPQAPQGDTTPAEPSPQPEPSPASDEPETATWRGDTVSAKQAEMLETIEQRFQDCDTPKCTFEKIQKARQYASEQPKSYAQRIHTIVQEAWTELHDGHFEYDVDRKAIWKVVEAAKEVGGIELMHEHLEYINTLAAPYDEETQALVEWAIMPYWGIYHIWQADEPERFDSMLATADQRVKEAVEGGHYTQDVADIARQMMYREAHAAAQEKGIELEDGTDATEEDDLFGKPELSHNDQG